MPAANNTPTPPKRKRIVIVDDHPVFRAGLVAVLAREPDLEICGEAESAAEAFDLIGRLDPDLVLSDISLPGKSGVDLIHDIRALSPDVPVLAISMHDERLYAERVLRAGGRGYVMKSEGPGRMLDAIRKVLAGNVAVSENIALAILDALSRPAAKDGATVIGKLSDREFEVLRLIGRGKDGSEIASALHLSLKTVDTHRAHIRRKLGLKSNTELIHYAVRWIGEPS